MTYNNILASVSEGILTITVNRPDKMNALNRDTLVDLSNIFNYARKTPEVKVIIITGSGQKAFVAGADIAEFLDLTQEQGGALSRNGHDLFHMIENFNKPVIAAVNGFALGGGLELAMACHLRIASDNAKMGLPEVTLGLIPGYGGTQRLTNLIGRGKALEMIMTADMIDANEAKTLGLVNHVTTQENLLARATELAQKIMMRSPVAIGHAIAAVNQSIEGCKGYEAEIAEFSKCFGSHDFVEGTKAFLEKRKPVFPGN